MKTQDPPHYGKPLKPWQRQLLIAAGVVSLALGLAGIPLPLLPTTPFLLLSAWLFARSSEPFYHWLLNHRFFGKNIRNYRNKGGVSLGVKIWAITLLWFTILLSAVVVVDHWWVKGILLIIAIGVSIHIGSLKTIRPGKKKDPDEPENPAETNF